MYAIRVPIGMLKLRKAVESLLEIFYEAVARLRELAENLSSTVGLFASGVRILSSNSSDLISKYSKLP